MKKGRIHTMKNVSGPFLDFATTCVLELGFAKPGDSAILTAGHNQTSGGTDMLRILKLY